MTGDTPETSVADITLRLAGAIGEAGLMLSAQRPGVLAAVDQHAATLRDTLPGRPSANVLLHYAHGFVEAAIGRGWLPAPGQLAVSGPDWESLRLAAVCRLVTEAMAGA